MDEKGDNRRKMGITGRRRIRESGER